MISTMRRIISIPILYRLLIKLLLCVIIVNMTGVVTAGRTDDEHRQDIETAVNAATSTLQREVNSLYERLELFEMKHETLQAASEQFKIQSKSAKSKLDEERKRYETLASGKRSLETSLETKLANALEDQKSAFEDTVISEHVEKQVLLKKENEDLEENLRLLEQQQSMKERNSKTKLQEQYKRYELLEKKKSASDDKLRSEITDLKQRLSSSETQTKSFEESWRKATTESDVKDELLQEESNKRVEEASRWEQRIHKLNAESTGLLSDLGIKEDELTKAGKAHTTLFEDFRKSEERIQRLESQIEAMRADNQNLSNELKSKTNELMRSKKAHANLFEEYETNRDILHDTEVIVNDLRREGEEKETKKKALHNELRDIKFELETSKSKAEQLIQEKSKLTKTYTEALNNLTLKNNGLRSELVDTKFDLENSQNKTKESRQETAEITKAQENTIKNLESERKKLKASRTEFGNLERDYEIMTGQFEKSEAKIENLLQRIDKEVANNTEITMSQDRATKSYTEALNKFMSKNTGLRSELVDIKFELENSQNKTEKSRQETAEIIKTQENTLKILESERRKLKASKTEYANLKKDLEMITDQFNVSSGKVKSLLHRIDKEVAKNAEIQKAQENTLKNLENERKKLKTSRTEYANLKRDYEMMTDQFNESNGKVKSLLQRIDEEATRNTEIQNELVDTKLQVEESRGEEEKLRERQSDLSRVYEEIKEVLKDKETKLLESNQNYKIIKEHDVILQKNLDELERKIEELTKQLDLKDSKNSYLQKMLLETKYNFEDSQNAVKQLEERMQEASNASSKEVLQLKTENKKTTRQKGVLERELQQSTTLYIGISQEINVLRDQLNATESKSTKFSHMYVSLKVENDVLSRNLHAASVDIQKKIVSFEQCDTQLRDAQSALKAVNDSSGHGMRTLVLQLKEKQKAHELCDEELHNAKSSLKISHDTFGRDLRIANLQLKEKEDALVQYDKRFSIAQSMNQADIDRKMHTVEAQLKKSKDEFEKCDKQLGGTRTEHSKLMQEYDKVSELNQVEIDRKIHTMETQFKKKEDESEQCDVELRDTRTVHSKLIQEYDNAKGIIDEKETKILLQQNAIEQAVMRKSEIESLALQRQNDLTETKIKNSELTADLATVNENLTGAKSVINQTETLFLLKEVEVAELMDRTARMEKLLQRRNDLTETSIKNFESTADLVTANENLVKAKSGIDKMETSLPLQEAEVAELKKRTAVTEKLMPPITVEERSEDESQLSNVQEILDKEPTQVENLKSSDSSSENDSTSTPSKNTWGPLGWFRSIVPFFQWLDYTLYKILRIVVDSTGLLTKALGKIKSFFSFGWVKNVIRAPFGSIFSIVLWVFNELLIIHDAFVSLFEFEMTFASSLLSSEKDRTGLSFLIRHSKIIVILGEVVATLLCLDLIISFFLYPKRRRRRPTAKTIEVPKTANASLLRTAKNI